MTIDERIKNLEFLVTHSPIHGTSITRVMHKTGLGWCLSLGIMQNPKMFFYGNSIEECLIKAENKLDLNKNEKEI